MKAFIQLGRKKKIRQVAVLYVSLAAGIIVSVFVSVINTHSLGVGAFGDYKFLQNLSMFAVSCGTLGLFVSGGRLLTGIDDQEEVRQIVGATIMVMLLLYIPFAIGFWIYSSISDNLVTDDIASLIRLSLPFAYGFILKVLLENILKGLNRIYSLAAVRLLPNTLYLVYAYFLAANELLSLKTAYLGFLLCSAFVFTVILIGLKPKFDKLGSELQKIVAETRTYGFNVYLGILASVASMQFGGVMVAYLIDTTAAGLFLLARTITMPLVQVATSIGVTFFRTFASKERIPQIVLLGTIGISVVVLALFILVVEDLVVWLYPPDFREILSLVYIMAIGSTLQGLGGGLNNFICAKGFGALSRNASFIRGAINCVGYTVVVAYFGIEGAAWTVLFSGMFFFVALTVYYRKTIRSLVVS